MWFEENRCALHQQDDLHAPELFSFGVARRGGAVYVTMPSCSPIPIPAVEDSSWSASELISAVESARAQQAVTFYLYDKPDIPMSVAEELHKLERCGTPAKLYHYGGAYWFLRQLLNHSWRVSEPARAQLLVVPNLHEYDVAKGPGGGGRGQFCKGLKPTEKIMKHILHANAWRHRPLDHVFVGLDWEYRTIPGQNASEHGGMLRGFVETRWSTPMTHGFTPRSLGGHAEGHFLVVAPYVDNGPSYYHDTLAERWAQEEALAFAAPSQPSRQALRTKRNVTHFFGGRTSTRIGPGRAQLGYYVRWSLMRQWAAHHFRNPRHIAPQPSPSAHVRSTWGSLLIVDSDRSKDKPAVPPCDQANSSRCLRQCAPNETFTATSGACLGHYSPSQVLSRARFSLCLRGDIPSSPRPYDSFRYGAIPIIISDHVWRMGMPFQCWVPWRAMTRSISESAFMHDAGVALHNISSGLGPAAEERMRQLIAHFRRDVLWRHPRSRVAENVLLAAFRWRNRDAQRLRGCCPLPDEIRE